MAASAGDSPFAETDVYSSLGELLATLASYTSSEYQVPLQRPGNEAS